MCAKPKTHLAQWAYGPNRIRTSGASRDDAMNKSKTGGSSRMENSIVSPSVFQPVMEARKLRKLANADRRPLAIVSAPLFGGR